MCSEVIDLRGPITVNGVPQGPSTLTIDTSCTKPVDSVYVDIPQAVIEQFSAGGTATATVEDGGELLKVGMHGAKSGEVSIQTSPDLVPGEALNEEVVPIHGSPDYFPEVM